MAALALATWLMAAGGASELKVLDIQVYLFDRRSGEMAPVDERAAPVNVSGDLIAIVKISGSAETAKMNVKVLEGKKKRIDETRSLEDTSNAPYEMFYLRVKELCAETTITATVTKGKQKAARTTTRHFACE
jgi:hypothetical protein